MELYLDCAATTKIDKEVLDEYNNLLSSFFASTGSLHKLGQETLILENESRSKIASLLKVKPQEILFNSGATEGNNYAIKGVAFNYKNRGKTLITSKVEHPSVLQCFKQLETDYGYKCIYIDVDENGILDLKQLQDNLSKDVILVSIMYVNHEVGSIMPIKKIKEMISKYPKIIFHSDITQALGKCDVDLSLVDIATMSAHKIHGIKGSGFIYKKEKVTLYSLFSGHESSNSLRAGTSNWPSNVVLSKALLKSLKSYQENKDSLKETQIKLIEGLKLIEGVEINTSPSCCISGIVNFSVLHYNPEVIIRALSLKGIYVSSKSVCSTKKEDQVSSTLKAMNKNQDVCISSIRVSYDHPLEDEQINYFLTSIKEVIMQLKR